MNANDSKITVTGKPPWDHIGAKISNIEKQNRNNTGAYWLAPGGSGADFSALLARTFPVPCATLQSRGPKYTRAFEMTSGVVYWGLGGSFHVVVRA